MEQEYPLEENFDPTRPTKDISFASSQQVAFKTTVFNRQLITEINAKALI
ncbi:hypothetical protein J26TS2_01670 [Shouchella clausii]|nr:MULTISPECIES: hypothetical protein [Shouchella]GIN10300.1 hypothetical protein J26TS2_01670 [Shouchella clausii]